jgi:FkbM family methyltransferase
MKAERDLADLTRGVRIPHTQMGKVSSADLFEPREQAIFDFYERSRGRYRKALDLGANLGVHSILMARQGWEVMALEPDPEHYLQLLANLEANGVIDRVSPCRAAASTERGRAEFVRVLDNTTANHLAGARAHHGPVERITVHTLDCRELFAWADFAKVDVEGHEAELLRTVTPAIAERCELMVEVGSLENAEAIFAHFHGWTRLWSQKTCWQEVRRLGDMPMHYTQGSLFIGEAWR